jgi:hypothetical protein
MSAAEEPTERLDLVGYEKITEHGLGLPVFGRSPRPNVFYTARCSDPVGAGGLIAGFDLYEPDGLVGLPLDQVRETGIGEPWLDVFLWEGAAYVGTAAEIWHALGEARTSIAEHAPLSLLALAEGDASLPASQLSGVAFSWLTERYGKQRALKWCRDTHLRGILLKALRRELGNSVHKAEMRLALQEKLSIQQHGNTITANIMPPLPFLPEVDVREFHAAASSFGLASACANDGSDTSSGSRKEKERSLANRTTEDAMRVAALRVAASKPEGKATTTELKHEVSQYLVLTPRDMAPSKTRPNEVMYQQIVGNIVSHRKSRNNIFARGWAIYTGRGIQITDAGREYLRALGL